jgi:hypothetical protein
MIIFGFCTKCDNYGHIMKATDERISPEDETDYMAGLRMVEGGTWYKTVKVACPDLLLPKHKVTRGLDKS